MRSPTNYYGGKTRLAPLIASLLPPHRTYVEPFFGSGAVLFAKPTSPTEVINDRDGHVVNFFRVLRDQPDALERACRLTPYARDEYAACADLSVDDPVEQARRWWVRVNQSFGKANGNTGWAAKGNDGSADHPHKLVSFVRRMEATAERLRTAYIENRPALDLFTKYTAPRTAFYVDPPYLGTTRGHSARGSYSDYAVDMPGEDDHRALAEALHATAAAVILSGYHSPLYDELYGDWWHLEIEVDRPTSNGHGRAMARAVEVIWSNRSLNAQQRFDLLEVGA